MAKFSNAVEIVKSLSISEQEELHQLLEKFLNEARRDEIYENLKKAKKVKNRKFTSSMSEIKARLKLKK